MFSKAICHVSTVLFTSDDLELSCELQSFMNHYEAVCMFTVYNAKIPCTNSYYSGTRM
jgi:hypothetical protein